MKGWRRIGALVIGAGLIVAIAALSGPRVFEDSAASELAEAEAPRGPQAPRESPSGVVAGAQSPGASQGTDSAEAGRLQERQYERVCAMVERVAERRDAVSSAPRAEASLRTLDFHLTQLDRLARAAAGHGCRAG